jgi:hypothetical protein
MTIRSHLHSRAKRAEAVTLLDSGATENFINLQYAKWLRLPILTLLEPRKLYNVDGTENKAGMLRFYTDLFVQTGSTTKRMRFYLADLGEHKVILGYPWFAANQPRIDWKLGWMDHTQLPVVIHADNVAKAKFLPQTTNVPRPIYRDQYFIGRVTVHPAHPENEDLSKIPEEYQRHSKVFSEDASQRLPEHTIWDHAIELLPGAPKTLPRRLLPLKQDEIQAASDFVAEHLDRKTIQRSISPYAANFFFVKKKDCHRQSLGSRLCEVLA